MQTHFKCSIVLRMFDSKNWRIESVICSIHSVNRLMKWSVYKLISSVDLNILLDRYWIAGTATTNQVFVWASMLHVLFNEMSLRPKIHRKSGLFVFAWVRMNFTLDIYLISFLQSILLLLKFQNEWSEQKFSTKFYHTSGMCIALSHKKRHIWLLHFVVIV